MTSIVVLFRFILFFFDYFLTFNRSRNEKKYLITPKMNNASPTTEFITGGNRRIGFQLIKHISVSPNNVVISSIRGSVLQAKNKQLQELMKGTNNIHIAQLDIVDAESIDQLESEIRIIPFVDGIDVFISSAAISDAYYEVLNVPKKVWLDHYTTNTLGPIFVLQKFLL